MTATPFSPSRAGYAPRSGRGLFRRVFDTLVAARQAKVRRQIAGHLATYSDAQLKEIGFSRDELLRWQARGGLSS